MARVGTDAYYMQKYGSWDQIQRSKAAEKGWHTRRAKAKAKKCSAAAKKGWITRRKNDKRDIAYVNRWLKG